MNVPIKFKRLEIFYDMIALLLVHIFKHSVIFIALLTFLKTVFKLYKVFKNSSTIF